MQRSAYSSVFSRDEVDARASRYVSGVYLYMMLGVMVTALVAYSLLASGIMLNLAVGGGSGFALGVFAAQFLTLMAFRPISQGAKPGAAMAMFFFYAALSGVTVGYAGLAYQLTSILNCFAIAALAFGGLAAFGHVTKRQLGMVGTFCMQALFMLVLFSLVFVVASFFPAMRAFLPAMDRTLAIVGLLVFSGLTAWESQMVRQTGYSLATSEASDSAIARYTAHGALTMYLNFLNLFLSLLRLFGDRRR